MAQVSKFMIRTDVWERIFDLFISTLADLRDKKKLSEFIDDFFSPTEKIVFAKRLALMVLLAKGQDYQSIRNIIKVSPPTIAKMSLKVKYEGKGLQPVIEDIFQKEAYQVIWKEISGIFDLPTKLSLRSAARLKQKSINKKKIDEIKSGF